MDNYILDIKEKGIRVLRSVLNWDGQIQGLRVEGRVFKQICSLIVVYGMKIQTDMRMMQV